MKDTLSRAKAVDRALVALRNCFVPSHEGQIGEYADAFLLRDGQFDRLLPDGDGIVKSQAFPGLWLNVPALISGRLAEVLVTLQKGCAAAEHCHRSEEERRHRSEVASAADLTATASPNFKLPSSAGPLRDFIFAATHTA